MNEVQKFGQLAAITLLSVGPMAAAMIWIGHVIQDPLSQAGTLAVSSVVVMVIALFVIGVLVVTVTLVIFWVWVFGVAWSSDEAREARADVE